MLFNYINEHKLPFRLLTVDFKSFNFCATIIIIISWIVILNMKRRPLLALRIKGFELTDANLTKGQGITFVPSKILLLHVTP